MIRRWEEETMIDSLQKKKKTMVDEEEKWVDSSVCWLVGWGSKRQKIIMGISIN